MKPRKQRKLERQKQAAQEMETYGLVRGAEILVANGFAHQGDRWTRQLLGDIPVHVDCTATYSKPGTIGGEAHHPEVGIWRVEMRTGESLDALLETGDHDLLEAFVKALDLAV